MTRRRPIIALVIVNLILLPFTLTMVCGDAKTIAPVDEADEGLPFAHADLLATLATQMQPRRGR